MQIVVDLKDRASKQLGGINKKFSGMVAAINPVTLAIAGITAGLAAVGGAAVVSVNAFRDFEEGMAGVAKTTGMSGEALAELGDGIKDMAKSIPLAHTGLADIAASAGQLGIQGKDNILAFTKTVAEVATAFDISADKAATSMGIMANIYKLPIEEISNLGSAINVMGNTTAASESQVLSFMTNLGASGVSLGFTSDQAAAMGATLVSMGQDGSDAGTRMKAAFTKMSQNIDSVAAFLGVTEEEFRKAFGKDPMGMIQLITNKLNKIKDPLEKDAAAAELFGQIGAKAMNSLAGGSDMLTINLENSKKGFDENTSLAEEFAAKTNTLNASFQLLKNHLTGVAIKLGEKLAPYVAILVEKFIELIPKIEAFASGISNDILPGIISFASKLKNDLQPGLDSLWEVAGSIIDILKDLYTDFTNSETAMSTLSSVVSVLVESFNFLADAAAAVWKFFADHPTITKVALAIVAAIVLITTPILAIIAAIALLAVAWDQNWYGIKDTVLRIVDIIVEKVTWFLGIIEELWEKHGETITGVVMFVWDLIKFNIENAMNLINTVINVVLDIIEGDWSSAWDRIVEYVVGVKDRALEIFDKWFGDSIQKLTDFIEESIQKFVDWKDETVQKITDWKDESIQKITDFVDASIQKFIDWKDETIQKFIDWKDESIQKIVDFVVESIHKFTNWRDESIQQIVDFVVESIHKFTNWRDESIQKIVDFVVESIHKFTNWRDEGIQKIVDFAEESIQEFSDWASESLSKIETWASDVLGEIENWVSNTLSEIENWSSDTLEEVEIWSSDTLSVIESWASDTLTEFESWASETLGEVESWASDTLNEIESWASDAVSEIEQALSDIVSEFESKIGGLDSFVKGVFDAISSSVSSAMNSVKSSVSDAWSKVKSTIDSIIDKINSIPGVPDIHNKSAPHDKSSGGHSQSHYDRASCSLYDVSGYDRGAIKFQHGGPVSKDLNADLHEGEYVVPKKGALVMKNSDPSHVKITYNFGDVYGVNDLERLLEKHDRDLYKKLVALV